METCPLELRESCALVCFAFCFVHWCLTFALYGSTSRYWLSVTFLGEMVGEQENKRRRGIVVWKGGGRCDSKHWIEFLYRWSKFGNSIKHLNRLWGRLKAIFKKSVQNIKHFCVCWTELARCVWWCLWMSVEHQSSSPGGIFELLSPCMEHFPFPSWHCQLLFLLEQLQGKQDGVFCVLLY